MREIRTSGSVGEAGRWRSGVSYTGTEAETRTLTKLTPQYSITCLYPAEIFGFGDPISTDALS